MATGAGPPPICSIDGTMAPHPTSCDPFNPQYLPLVIVLPEGTHFRTVVPKKAPRIFILHTHGNNCTRRQGIVVYRNWSVVFYDLQSAPQITGFERIHRNLGGLPSRNLPDNFMFSTRGERVSSHVAALDPS